MAFTPGNRAVISFVVDGVQTAERQIKSLSGTMDGFGSHIAGSLKELAAFAGVGLGLAAIAEQVLEAQREFDKLNASLVTATGSTANAAQAFNALQAFASSTPYSVKEATEAFIKMRNLGLDPSEKALRSYGNTAAAMGKDLNQMIEAVADASTGEFERLKEFGITAAKNGSLVALTFQGMTKRVGNNTKEIQAYLQSLGNVNFAGAMEKRANTLDGAISNLGDAWSATMRTIAQNGIGEVMMSGVLALSGSLSDLSAILDVVGGAVHKEGEQVKEASLLHETLTGTFKGIVAVGVLLAAGFQEVREELGALAALGVTVAHGDFAGAKAIIAAREADMASLKKSTEDKVNAIGRSTAAAKAAQEQEAAALKASGKDRLGQLAIELTVDQKRAKAKQDIFDIENKLNGVNAETSGELAKLKVALDAGAISQAEYGKYVAKINKETIENSTAYKDQVKQLDLSAAAIKHRAEAQALLNQREQEHIAFLHESGQLDEEGAIKRIAAAQVQDLNNQSAALEAQLVLAKRKVDNKKEQVDLEGQLSNLETKINSRRQKEDEDLFMLEQKRYRLAADNYADLAEKTSADTKAQKDSLRDQQDEIAQLGMTEKQIASVNSARLLDMAARAEENALIAEGVDWSGKLSDEYRTQADLLRQRASLTVYSAELKQQKELWSTIESTAHDTFISIFDSGKSAFDRLRDTLKNGLLDLLYQMTVKKWILNIGASVGIGGASGVAQAANAIGGTAGSPANSLIGAAQTASSLFSAITGGLSGSLGAGITAAGDMFGSAAVSAFGSGLSGGSSVAGAAQAYSAAGNTTVASSLSAGSTVAQYVPAVAVAVASYFAAKTIAGGYKVEGVGNLLNLFGAAGGLVNRAFGMKDKEVTGTGLMGTLSADGLSGSAYAKWHQDGGWFRSDKDGTDKTAFSADIVSQFTQGFNAIKQGSVGFATSIGASVDSLASYSKAFDIKLTTDNAANEKAIADFFQGMGDEIALRLVPNLADFTKSGETASAALQRLSGDFQGTNQIANLVGKTALSMFGSLGIESAAARERLANLGGSVTTLSTQAASFAQNYLTDAERLAPVADAVSAAMSSLGLASVTTREQFKQVVQGLDVTTAAGAQQFTSMMALADSFAQVHPLIEVTTTALRSEADILGERKDLQKQLDELTLSSADLLTRQRDAIDASNRGLFDQVQAAQAAKSASDAAKSSLGDFLGKMQSFAESVKGFNSNLLTGSLSALTPEQQYAEARREFDQASQAAAAGDAAAQGNLQAIENTFLGLSQKINGGDSQYSSDMATVLRTNDQLSAWASSTVDKAQASLDAMNAQVSGIATLNGTMLTVAQNIQTLPAAFGSSSTPVLPQLDYSNYGTANVAPLVAAITALQDEVKALRADAERQAGDGIGSNIAVTQQAAERIVTGMRAAATDASWAADSSTRAPT